ncbi:MAG: 16S rRNA (cytosine(1402)-N(4))-methyltransferase, partial [Candidatus Fraserbacteria bacterium RBG_16_55_9]
MEMQSFEKWFVNSRIFNFVHTRVYLPKVFALMDGHIGSIALELGCGTGVTTREILRRFPNVRVIAIDYDPEQVKAAKQRLASFGNRIVVQQGDATALALPDASVDAVFEFNVFHHIHECEKAMAEIWRVLKPGGAFYAMDLSQRFFQLPLIESLFPPEVLFTKQEFIQSLEASGLRVRRTAGSELMFY